MHARARPAWMIGAALLLCPAVAAAGGRYGHHHDYGHHHHGGSDAAWIALGVTGALVGAAILANAATQPRATYAYPPPPPPVYAYPPPAAYEPPDPAGAYAEGYRAGLDDARRARERAATIDYGLGSRATSGTVVPAW
jgi:hypothetical protein